MSEKQLNLFEVRPAYRVEQPKKVMSKEALQNMEALGLERLHITKAG